MNLVTIENELLRFGVLAGKGTDIIEFNYKKRDLDFAWLTPGGVRNPVENYSTLPDGLGTFTDSYPGGWQEIFPNGGEPSTAHGATFGQHGEVCTLPWDVTIAEDTPEAVAVDFAVRTMKTPFRIEKRLRLAKDSPTLTLAETITNLSAQRLDTMWGQHLAWGRPFLDESCVIRVPDGVNLIAHNPGGDDSQRRIKTDRPLTWPVTDGIDGSPLDLSKVPPKDTNSEMLYFTDLSEGWYEVESIDKGIGVRVEWEVTVMPYLWFWQEFGGTRGYPWYGDMYTVGLEPFSSLPTTGLAGAIANGSTCVFEPNQSKDFKLSVTVFESKTR
jgi:hypothetical protein